VHGAVLAHEPATQVSALQGVQLAEAVVVDELLGEVQQRPQLAQRAAVRLHLGRVVVRPEEGAVVVGGDVTPLVDDVQKARQQHLRGKERGGGEEQCHFCRVCI